MNLVLYSSLFGNQEVEDFIRKNAKHKDPKICIIPSFTNFMGVEYCGMYKDFVDIMHFKEENMSIFDVGYLFDDRKVEWIFDNDVVVLGGGNTFLFQWLLKRNNMFNVLNKFVREGGILIGESAGSIMMSNTIKIASFADQDIVCSEDKCGLGLVDFEVKPHFGSWIKYYTDFIEYSKTSIGEVYCLFDGGYIIVENDVPRVHGNYILLKDGKVKNFCINHEGK